MQARKPARPRGHWGEIRTGRACHAALYRAAEPPGCVAAGGDRIFTCSAPLAGWSGPRSALPHQRKNA